MCTSAIAESISLVIPHVARPLAMSFRTNEAERVQLRNLLGSDKGRRQSIKARQQMNAQVDSATRLTARTE